MPMNDRRTLRTLPADLLTPVGAYLLLREALGTPAFLLESVERGEQVGRYSFLGAGLPTTDSLDEAVAFASGTPGPADGQPPSSAAPSAIWPTTGSPSWSRCRPRRRAPPTPGSR